jgi:hypothetical protein
MVLGHEGAGVVHAVGEGDGVPEALDRLRRGEGDRSVIVVDPSVAGATAGEPVPAAISASPSLLSDWHRTQRRAT